jgi:hypothetical protein
MSKRTRPIPDDPALQLRETLQLLQRNRVAMARSFRESYAACHVVTDDELSSDDDADSFEGESEDAEPRDAATARRGNGAWSAQRRADAREYSVYGRGAYDAAPPHPLPRSTFTQYLLQRMQESSEQAQRLATTSPWGEGDWRHGARYAPQQSPQLQQQPYSYDPGFMQYASHSSYGPGR